MGTLNVTGAGAKRLRSFTKQLLGDLHTLERMLDNGAFDGDAGTRRIGAEQELFLIDADHRPAPIAEAVLEHLGDDHFTTELARFNMEMNLDPQSFDGDCLTALDRDLEHHLQLARSAARDVGADVIMAGILPTLDKSDLDLDRMTPKERYKALNDALTRLRGSDYHFHIAGTDELSFKHSSVMLEACNTSFQLHFQVHPREFVNLYNFAQALTAPVLAAAANSPLLFGKRLWRETRIALFQQSVDTRRASEHLREMSPRVSFGDRWLEKSVLEIYREDISRFKVLLATDVDEDSLALYTRGETPALRALLLHNSTIYRWNRPCYGVAQGVPHLRIENRSLPAGPSVRDAVANAAFWFGLLAGYSHEYDDITPLLDFDDAKSNFIAAARLGLDAHFTWFDGRTLPAKELILDEMLPVARRGLQESRIDCDDINLYLGIIAARVESGRTGAQWQLNSLSRMRKAGSIAERLGALTAAMKERQLSGEPVHRWQPAQISESGGWQRNFLRVEQIMSKDLFTVHEDEVIDLVAGMMHWKHIRHIPVEDHEHLLVGLVSYRTLLRFLAEGMFHGRSEPVAVSEVMEKDIITATPETSTVEAMRLMRKHGISCLPVTKNGRLVGIVSEHDFMEVARGILEETLSDLSSD